MIKRPRNEQNLISEAELKSKGRENEFNEITGENFTSQRGKKTFKYKSQLEPQLNMTKQEQHNKSKP